MPADIVEWGKDAIHGCRALNSTVRHEACVYGVTSTIAGDFARAKQRFIDYGARDIQGYVGYTMRFGSKSLCPGLQRVSAEASQLLLGPFLSLSVSAVLTMTVALQAVERACIMGWLRYALPIVEHAPRLICGAVSRAQENTMPRERCMELAVRYRENADAEELHFLIVPDEL